MKMNVRVVLVEPKYEGNIGSAARVMKNFGFKELVLVKPPPLGEVCRAMASHAVDVLDNCETVDSFEDGVKNSNVVVGTTGITGKTDDEHVRMPFFTPEELGKKLQGKRGNVSLIFGREDAGLNNEEVKKCDMIVSIPTCAEYPVMNLSHAVAIILYELSEASSGEIELAGRDDLDRLYEHFQCILDRIDYPKHKRDKTLLMLRRIFGRAMLTGREVQTFRGILRKIEFHIKFNQRGE